MAMPCVCKTLLDLSEVSIPSFSDPTRANKYDTVELLPYSPISLSLLRMPTGHQVFIWGGSMCYHADGVL